MAYECYKCKSPCVIKEEKGKLFGFPCDFCKKIICGDCTGALAGEIRIIPSPTRTTCYFCPNCKNSIRKVPEIQKIVQKSQEDLKRTQKQGDETAKKLEKLKGEVDALKGYMDKRRAENEAFLGEVSELRKEVKILDQKIPGASYADALKNLEKKVDTIKKGPEVKVGESEVELTLFEMKERERRAGNILFFGVEESKKTNPEEKVKDEKDMVSTLFTQMNLSLPPTAKIFRLGRETPDKKRPIKVVLASSHEAWKALKNKKILEQNAHGVYIKADQTETQRKYLKQVIAELENQKKAGRQNIIIKYINGIPKIIEKHEKN